MRAVELDKAHQNLEFTTGRPSDRSGGLCLEGTMKKNVFDKYLEGLEKLKEGDREAASKEIGQIFGGEGSTAVIEANADRIYKTGSRVNRAITDGLFSAEQTRRRKEKE